MSGLQYQLLITCGLLVSLTLLLEWLYRSVDDESDETVIEQIERYLRKH